MGREAAARGAGTMSLAQCHAMAAEDWTTREGLRDIARTRSAQIAGWRAPVAFALGYRTADGWQFPHVNPAGSGTGLSAVVLAEVVGYSHGTAEIAMTREQVARAVANLSPAEAVTDLKHPNLGAWRAVAAADAEEIAAVFIGDLTDPPAGAADAALRALL